MVHRGHLLSHVQGAQNTLFTGLGVVAVTSGIGLVVACAQKVWIYIKEKFLITLDVQSTDNSYEWLLQWLAELPEMKMSRRLGVETSFTGRDGQAVACLVPSLGTHRIKYQNHTMWINRTRESTYNMASGHMFESLTITVHARGDGQVVLRQMIDEALTKGMSKDAGKTVIFTASRDDWKRFAARAKRPWKSVILPPGVKESLLEDAKKFLNSESWYRDRGIPYRRGYLLYGTPGSGKSTLVHTLAGELNLNICMVSLAQADMTDEVLVELLNCAPPNALLLIEDVDVAFCQRLSAEKSNGVTLSGLLNALDGVAAQEGRLMFMTTNRIHALDPALIRDGRVDARVHLGHATKTQATALFVHFYALDPKAMLVKQFEHKIIDGELTMASLQGYFMNYRTDAEASLKNIDEFLQQQNSKKSAEKLSS